MSNTYTWSISALDCIPNVNGETDYVVVAHWACDGDDGDGHIGRVYTTQSFAVNPAKTNYVPFADLTESQVIAWVQDAMGAEGVDAVYSSINTQIENQINPPIVTPPLPWSKTEGKAPETVDPKQVV